MKPLKVGIAVDAHKRYKFREALVKDGYSFTEGLLDKKGLVYFFKIFTDDSKLKDIENLCIRLQINFNHSN